jgi:putative chitinase
MFLKIGSTGDDVKKLQTILGLTPDGSFGPITERTLKKWQSRNNLPPDGIAGDAVWGILFPGTASPVASSILPNNYKLGNLRGAIPDSVLAQIPETAVKFNISNVLRLAHFLAQCGHESTGFKDIYEKLNYSADRLKVIFPKYFPGTLSDSYANNPMKIASRVYASRMGNGDEASGEGYKFRGRGFIQLTGKDNYTRFAKYIGDDTVANPDLVATRYPLASAAFYFDSNGLWAICDRGDSAEAVTAVTKAVNSGLLGLPDRIKHFNDYYTLLR